MSQDEFKPYDSDHTALVHVLWAAKHKSLTLDSFDELASHIMRSKWFQAVKAHTQAEAQTARTAEIVKVINAESYGRDDSLAEHSRRVARFLERRFGGGER